MLAFKTILHPTDFSEASEHAFQMAVGLARDYHATLVVLHSVEPPVYYGELGVNFIPPEEYQAAAQERLEKLIGQHASLRLETVVVEGMAAAKVVEAARERACDLIVIGSHGRSGLGRVLMGSVAEEVARKSPCPVLIVRAPHEINEVGPVEAMTAVPAAQG